MCCRSAGASWASFMCIVACVGARLGGGGAAPATRQNGTGAASVTCACAAAVLLCSVARWHSSGAQWSLCFGATVVVVAGVHRVATAGVWLYLGVWRAQVSHTLDRDEQRLKRSLEEQGAALGGLFAYDGTGDADDEFDRADIEKVRWVRMCRGGTRAPHECTRGRATGPGALLVAGTAEVTCLLVPCLLLCVTVPGPSFNCWTSMRCASCQRHKTGMRQGATTGVPAVAMTLRVAPPQGNARR